MFLTTLSTINLKSETFSDMETLSDTMPQIEKLCRLLNIRRLDIFGSATRDFSSAGDVDILVQFEGEQDLFRRFFELHEGLEKIFGKPIDLVMERPIRNPFFKQSVEDSRRNIYAAHSSSITSSLNSRP
jgi:uncharacterized protein